MVDVVSEQFVHELKLQPIPLRLSKGIRFQFTQSQTGQDQSPSFKVPPESAFIGARRSDPLKSNSSMMLHMPRRL